MLHAKSNSKQRKQRNKQRNMLTEMCKWKWTVLAYDNDT